MWARRWRRIVATGVVVALLGGCSPAPSPSPSAAPSDAVRRAPTAPAVTSAVSAASASASAVSGSSAPSGSAAPATSLAPATSSAPSATPGPADLDAARIAHLPPLKERPVPTTLTPSPAAAPEDYPPTFEDHCNVPEGGTAPKGTCLYADLASTTTIALFGDSHAAFWFPALEGFAQAQDWRLLNLTMSSCTPADLSVYNSIFRRIYTECPAWRTQAVARLRATRPAVVVIAGTHGISPDDAAGGLISGPALIEAWQAGMARTIERLEPSVGLVILLADTPTSEVDPPTCLAAHPASVLACATPPDRAIDLPWLAAEGNVVAQTGAGFIDPTFWICSSDPCSPISGDVLEYQNAGHLTAVYAATLAKRMGEAILAQIAAHGGLKTP